MRKYRFKRQSSGFGVFAGITARTLHASNPPAADEVGRVGQRVWLDTSHVKDGFRDASLPLNQDEVDWLRSGLRRVADDIEAAEPDGYLTVCVEALEIVLVDYIEESLAPAIAGWAAEEFGFTPYQVRVSRGETPGQYVFQWAR